MRRLLCMVPGTLLAGVLLLTSGCRQGSEELEILCGNSFRPPMEELARRYEEETGKKVQMSFGGSQDLLPHIKLKAKGDVFVSHTPYQQYTKDSDALFREVEVGFQTPVLVVQKGNPKKIERFEDLARPGLRVVLPDPKDSTCGEMVFKRLEEAQITDQVEQNVGNHLVREHSEVGKQLQLDAADVGIMWNGVAHTFKDAVEIVPDPGAYEEIKLSVMGLSYSKKKENLADFLDFVEKHGKQVFEDFGYVK